MTMLELRAIPLDDNTTSPAELLGNRKYKTTLPAVTRAPFNNEAIWQSLLKRQNMLGMMPMPRSYHHSYLSSQYGYRSS